MFNFTFFQSSINYNIFDTYLGAPRNKLKTEPVAANNTKTGITQGAPVIALAAKLCKKE